MYIPSKEEIEVKLECLRMLNSSMRNATQLVSDAKILSDFILVCDHEQPTNTQNKVVVTQLSTALNGE